MTKSLGEKLAHAEQQLAWALLKEVDVPRMLFRMFHQLHDAGIKPDLTPTENRHLDNMKGLVQKRDNYRTAIRNLSGDPL